VLTASAATLQRGDFVGLEPSAGRQDLRDATRSTVRQVERRRIVEALAQHGGRKADAARALKISRASLYNKLKAYGL
jgi:DNA-binding NtrC family response regulator